MLQPWRRGGVGVAPFAHSPRGAWPRVGGPGSGPGGSERRVRVADSIPMAQGHRGRGGARVGGVGGDFGSAPPRAAACASGGLGYREGESRGGARSFCDRRGWVRCAAPPIFRASGAREVALILLSYAQTPFSVGLIARSPQCARRCRFSFLAHHQVECRLGRSCRPKVRSRSDDTLHRAVRLDVSSGRR